MAPKLIPFSYLPTINNIDPNFFFNSTNNLFVVGGAGRIAKSTDNGTNWSAVHNPGGSVQLWEVAFNSTGIGLASGASSTLLRSTDGGNTWLTVAGFPASQIFYTVRFASDNVAYLGGTNGYYYKSTDAGATWLPISYRYTSTRVRDVSFADELNGYCVGTNFLSKTTDGGFTWTTFTSPFTGDINEVVALSPSSAIAGADLGNVIKTTDGGTSWTVIPTGITGTNSDILAIDFVDENRGLVAAYNGTVATTTDGGLTWTIIATITGSSPLDMDMVDSLYAYVVGTGERIFATTDGGKTWTQQYAGGGSGTYGVSFVDRLNGVAGGTSGNTMFTTNGGTNWTLATTSPGQNIWGIHMARSNNGTIAMTACASGYVYKSIDGGNNWIQEPRLTINTFDDIYMTPNASHAWVVGSSGTTIKWVNPDAVPVELTSFKAALNGNAVLLNWSTASELNNAGFEIERSLSELSSIDVVKKSSNQWKKIGFVQGNGTTLEFKSYQFNDELNEYGTFNYRLKQIDFDGSFTYSNIVEIDNILPQQFSLFQNYPNPFNPETNISFTLPTEGIVNLKIFDVLGNEVAQLINEFKSPGKYTVSYQSGSHSPIASGVYLYRLELNSPNKGKQSLIRKMILIK